jgi:hypothetical protein
MTKEDNVMSNYGCPLCGHSFVHVEYSSDLIMGEDGKLDAPVCAGNSTVYCPDCLSPLDVYYEYLNGRLYKI